MMWGPMMWGPGGWWGFGMGLVSLVFFGLIVAGIVLLIRRFTVEPRGTPDAGKALDILDERFARGELDEDEYEARKRILLGAGRR